MNPTLLLLLGLILGLALGAVVGWLLKSSRAQREISAVQLRAEQAFAETQMAKAEAQRSRDEVQRAFNELDQAKLAQAQLSETLLSQFRNLATEILEERSKSFSQASSEKIGGLLSPLQQQLEHFRKRVEEVHESQTKSSSGLQQELERLARLNTAFR